MSVIRYRTFLLFSFFFLFVFSSHAQKELKLREALQKARVSNLDLRAQAYAVPILAAGEITAGLRPNPILNNQSLQLLQSSSFYTGTSWYSDRNRQVWWQLTRPFQLPGVRSTKIQLAKQNTAVGKADFQETERGVLRQVALKWLDVWYSRKHVALLAEARTVVDTLKAINALRLKNLVISQTDLFRADLLSRQYEVMYEQSMTELLNMERELGVWLGDSITRHTADTNDQLRMPIVLGLDSALQTALSFRNDLLSIQNSLEASKINQKLQRKQAYASPELGMIWNPQNSIPYFGFYGTWSLPIFSRNQGNIQRSGVESAQWAEQKTATEFRIRTEVENAWFAYRKNLENSKRSEELLAQAQQIRDNVRYAYLKSGTTIIDFLEAQRSWLETEQQHLEILKSLFQSQIDYFYTTGTLNQL